MTMADTEASKDHYDKVDNLTIAEIMGMDNDGLIDDPDLIDNLRYYLLDNLEVRKHMMKGKYYETLTKIS